MAYGQMAYYYDQLMQDAPYDKWTSFTEQMIQEFGKSVDSIVDLGCGTGQITTRLARSGYQMIGVDYSSDMLSLAEQRANTEQISIQWLQQDLRALAGIRNQDLAISFCDVLNYITKEKELRHVFESVSSMLKPGGLFMFDVHSFDHVEHDLVNQTFAEVSDDVSYIWYCLEGNEQGEMYHDLTFFIAEGNKYSRFDEMHHQRTFPISFYDRLLHDSGFEVRHITSDFSLQHHDINEQSERIFITAVKRSE
ncbi:Methyltransferase domain-containing protein [Lentibacillus halodurans]|uniref:Methyltransferase domain-containing protein n=1 Tax=Lentibacillus halodurans TaxID=237679 RepID=A0A1I0V1J1_9BACI|nr:class I SAM-dependent methyltransferase [Lentibacillus halodurans]SFA69917.1 Methyltransferase domain-containing protein [Lentibacillus halodurans]